MLSMELIKSIFYIVTAIFIVSGTIGGLYVWKFKIKKNCEATSNLSREVKDIKVLKLPYYAMESDCRDRKEAIQDKVTQTSEKLKEDIFKRLDQMDHERNEAKEKENEQRVLRVHAYTELATNVKVLAENVNKLEARINEGG